MEEVNYCQHCGLEIEEFDLAETDKLGLVHQSCLIEYNSFKNPKNV